MPNINLQINARGSNIAAQRAGDNVVIDIDNTATAQATSDALGAVVAATNAAAATLATKVQVEADAAAALDPVTGELAQRALNTETPRVVATRSALAAIPTADTTPRTLTEPGMEGLFVYDESVSLAAKQADALMQAYYVSPGFPTIIGTGARKRIEKEMRSKYYKLDSAVTDSARALNQLKIQSMLNVYREGGFNRLIIEGGKEYHVGVDPNDNTTCLSVILPQARDNVFEAPDGASIVLDHPVPVSAPRFHGIRAVSGPSVNGGSWGGGTFRLSYLSIKQGRPAVRGANRYALYIGGFEVEVTIDDPTIPIADNHGIVIGPNGGTVLLQKATINRPRLGTLIPQFDGQQFNGDYGSFGDTGIWLVGGCKDVQINAPYIRGTGDDPIFVGHNTTGDAQSVRIIDADIAMCGGSLKIALSKGRISGNVERTRSDAVAVLAYGASRPDDIQIDVIARQAGMLKAGEIGTKIIGTPGDEAGLGNPNDAAGIYINTDGSDFRLTGTVDVASRYGVLIRSGNWASTGVAAGYMRNLFVDVQLDRIGYDAFNPATGALGNVRAGGRGFSYDAVTGGQPLINADIRLNLGDLECPATAISSPGPSGTQTRNVTITLTGKSPEIATANLVDGVRYTNLLTRGAATTPDAGTSFVGITYLDQTTPPTVFATPVRVGTNADALSVNYTSRRIQVRKNYASTGSAMVVPQGYRCVGILLRNTSGNTVTSGINIGSAAGLTDIGGNVPLAANEIKRLDTGQLTIRPGSMAAPTNVFFGSGNWGNSTVEIELNCERIDWK